SFWIEKGKDWKWLLQCHQRTFSISETKDGVGNFRDPSGWFYMGDWKGDKREGYGVVELKDQERTKYKGHWVADKRFVVVVHELIKQINKQYLTIITETDTALSTQEIIVYDTKVIGVKTKKMDLENTLFPME